MIIENHYNLLEKKYKLSTTYKLFVSTSIISSLFKEGFYWGLIYFDSLLKKNHNNLIKYAIILITILSIHIPAERLSLYYKTKLLDGIKTSNRSYYQDALNHISKNHLVNADLVEFNNSIDVVNNYYEDYIKNIRNHYDLYLLCISFYIVALKINLPLLTSLFITFYLVTKKLNEIKFIKDEKLNIQLIELENEVRNYFITSKTLIVNNQFNDKYFHKKVKELETLRSQIQELSNQLDIQINMMILLIVIITIYTKRKEIAVDNFFYYFLMVYDIESIGDKIMEYYKDKVNFSILNEKLKYLNSVISERNHYIRENIKINDILISRIENKAPKLYLMKQLHIKKGDHILVTGESGNGKSSFFNIFKGIVNPEQLDININISQIINHTYLSVQNHKELYSGNLYDIITNYEDDKNIKLINYALNMAFFDKKSDNDEFIDVEKISGGEKARILIARTIYLTIKYKYQILLLDEIDENLNDKLATGICQNIRNIFKDRIIFYITHNDNVKKLFDKVITVTKGIIEHNIE